ncbi:MAG: hypothetical protein WC742_05005 [Gallionellaceae bacterium]|jgi:hypothetical protein
MASHPESAENSSAENAADASCAKPSKLDALRVKLKVLTHYLGLGFVPGIAVFGVVLGSWALIQNSANKHRIESDAAVIEELRTTLAMSRKEFDRLKTVVHKEKTVHGEKLKKHEERIAKIVENLTPIQVKLRISPTLEQQLNPPEAVSIVPPVIEPPKFAPLPEKPKPAKVEPVKPHAVKAQPVPVKPPVIKETAAVHAPALKVEPPPAKFQIGKVPPSDKNKTVTVKVGADSAPHTPEKSAGKPQQKSADEKPLSPQAQAIRDSIQQYNKIK